MDSVMRIIGITRDRYCKVLRRYSPAIAKHSNTANTKEDVAYILNYESKLHRSCALTVAKLFAGALLAYT